MRKVLFSLLLLVAICGLALDFTGFAGAQATKKAPDSATIEISAGKDSKFRFVIRDADEKLLAMSSPSGFATEKEAKVAIERLKALIGKAKVIVRKEAPKDK